MKWYGQETAGPCVMRASALLEQFIEHVLGNLHVLDVVKIFGLGANLPGGVFSFTYSPRSLE
jgi:hypothetical protein